jgi:hypothetical protein
MQVIKRLIGKPGLYIFGNRCWRVAKLFDECTPRREEVSKKAASLYRNGVYVGDCVIIYEVDWDLCAEVKDYIGKVKDYIGSAGSK